MEEDEKTLYIMQGISGSGKSTIACLIIDGLIARYSKSVAYCSTDELWYDDKGNYNFDMNRLGEMHRRNQAKVDEHMKDGDNPIIVDNTNTTQKEAKPYIKLAEKYGYTVRVISVSCNVDVAKHYNSLRPEDRQVPEAIIDNMDKRLTRIKL